MQCGRHFINELEAEVSKLRFSESPATDATVQQDDAAEYEMDAMRDKPRSDIKVLEGTADVDAVLTAPPANATEIAHSEAQRMFGAPAPAPAEPASTVITPPATQSRPQLDDEKERLRLERDAARRELEALKAQLAAQAPQSA